MKRELKSALGRLVYGTGLHRRLLRGRAFVVLFHRVDDRLAGDPITCTRSEFARYCAFFRRHFHVVPLGELLRKLRAGEDVTGDLVITFDDGYKDNHDVAAAELRRHGLPACFFIATDFIGSRTVPWWDVPHAHAVEWMTWDDVRDLAGQGFELGAHTMHHVDLGVVQPPESAAEIEGSRERLAAETGTVTPFFSYPYGRPEQITETNRAEVRRAGFDCCLSAYGGAVARGGDPYRVKRQPISPWYVSPHHLGFELLRATA